MNKPYQYQIVLTDSEHKPTVEVFVQSSKKLNLELLVASVLTGAKLGTHHESRKGNFYLIEDPSGPIGSLHYREP